MVHKVMNQENFWSNSKTRAVEFQKDVNSFTVIFKLIFFISAVFYEEGQTN